MLLNRNGMRSSFKAAGVDVWFERGVAFRSSSSVRLRFGDVCLPDMLSFDVGGVICDHCVSNDARCRVFVFKLVISLSNEFGMALSQCSIDCTKLMNGKGGRGQGGDLGCLADGGIEMDIWM